MAERMLLTNARILTCSGDPAEKPLDGDVLIEGNRIARVATGRLDVHPPSARVADLRGATLLPGLRDAPTHISSPLDFVLDHAGEAPTTPGPPQLEGTD